MNGIVWALLAACAVSATSARSFDSGADRRLQQVGANCPAGCKPGSCALGDTGGFKVCTLCDSNFQLNRDDGTCMCPEGQYSTGSACATCTKGFYCPGGMYNGAGAPATVACPDNMTTRGIGAPSIRQCVNSPGYYYSSSADGTSNIAAIACPVDTYSRGLRKQRACVPCPPAYTTNGATAATNSSACLVPPGYFVRAPGQIAPCPKGEYKANFGAVGTCTKCATGVTTSGVGSTSVDACTLLLPSFVSVTNNSNVITSTKKCPQNNYCPGGVGVDSTSKQVACATGLMTQGPGAQSVSECMVPPGWAKSGSGAVRCGERTYREGWVSVQETSACQLCGENIFSEPNEQVMLFHENGTVKDVMWVRGSSAACYIAAGQGMYMTDPTATPPKYRGVDCSTNNYGAANKTYGLAIFPCRDCPANLVTTFPASQTYFSNATAPDNTTAQTGFTSASACLTKPGYGQSGRGGTACRIGTYNQGGNNAACTECGTGFTTNRTAATSQEDCLIQRGYGYYSTNITSCPAGTYNDELKSLPAGGADAQCTDCPVGRTTESSRRGATAVGQCDQCIAGYGGANCATLCGGGAGVNATYGPARAMDGTACSVCPQMAVGFFYTYLGPQEYKPLSLTRPGADASTQCVSEFAQLGEIGTNWYLNGNATLVNETDATNLTACVEVCRTNQNCQYITFDYATGLCQTKIKPAEASVGNGTILAFKTVQTSEGEGAEAKTQGTGQWTYWKDTGANIGTEQEQTGYATAKACTEACNNDKNCAAVAMAGVNTVDTPATITKCVFIIGAGQLENTKRTLVKAALGAANTLSAANTPVLV